MKAILAVVAFTLVLQGCGGGSSGSDAGGTVSQTAPISGAVAKGPVREANVYVYRMDESGNKLGAAVAGPIQTDADGRWSANISTDIPRPLLIEAVGGSYQDEATGNTVAIGETRALRSFLVEGQITAPITPLTEAVVRGAQKSLSAGGTSVVDAVTASVATVQPVFGSGFDVLRDVPDLNGESDSAKRYSSVLGGLSKLANTIPDDAAYDELDKALALSTDLSDGSLDGQDEQNLPIVISEQSATSLSDATVTVSSNQLNSQTSLFVDESFPDDQDLQLALSPFVVSVNVVGVGGTVSAEDISVFPGDEVSFTVNAAPGYSSSVNPNDCPVGSPTGSTYTIDAVDTACSISVSFSEISYLVSVASPAGGSFSTATQLDAVTVNSSVSLAFTENTGFDLVSVTGCGGALDGLIYTFSGVTADCTITPTFELESYEVSFTASPTQGGTFDPAGPVSVDYDTTQAFTVTPNEGFELTGVSGCGVDDNAPTSVSFETGQVVGACEISATFVAIPEPILYTVTASGDSGVIASPTSQPIVEGSPADITFTAVDGFALDQSTIVSSCGGTFDSQTGTFTTGFISGNCNVSASSLEIFDVTVSTGIGGTSSGSTSGLAGETVSISITPDQGNTIATPISNSCSGDLVGNTYTVGPLDSDCTISIDFATGAVWGNFNWDDGALWQ